MSKLSKDVRPLTVDRVTPDSPWRLGVAAALAFPDGTMTACAKAAPEAKGRLDRQCGLSRAGAVD